MSSVRYVNVTAEVDPDDVLAELGDKDLIEMGLVRASSAHAEHEVLFAAAERGDCAAVIKAAEQIAWSMYGRILTGKVAA